MADKDKPFFDPVIGRMTTNEEVRRRWGGKRTVKGDVTFQDRSPSAKPVDGAPSTIDVEVEPVPPRTKR